MKYLIFVFGILLSCGASKSLINKVDSFIIDAKLDKLDNYYTMLDNGDVNMYDENLNLIYSYSDIQNQISNIDVSNPQKLLLYNADQNRIVFLDNTLSEIDNLEIDPEKYLDVPRVAMSNDNNIWIWDANEIALVKINENGEEISRSDLMTLLNIGDVNLLEEDGNNIYLGTDESLYIFSNLGLLQNTINIDDAKNININGEEIKYLRDGFLWTITAPLYEIEKEIFEVDKMKESPCLKYFFDQRVRVNHFGLERY